MKKKVLVITIILIIIPFAISEDWVRPLDYCSGGVCKGNLQVEGNLTVNGTSIFKNVTIIEETLNITKNINAQGNVTASYFFGNGTYLTSIHNSTQDIWKVVQNNMTSGNWNFSNSISALNLKGSNENNGQFLAPFGSNTAPGFSWLTDTDTGMYGSPGVFAFAINSVFVGKLETTGWTPANNNTQYNGIADYIWKAMYTHDLLAYNISTENLTAKFVNATSLDVNNLTAKFVNATSLDVNNLTAKFVNATSLDVNNFNVINITSKNLTFDYILNDVYFYLVNQSNKSINNTYLLNNSPTGQQVSYLLTGKLSLSVNGQQLWDFTPLNNSLSFNELRADNYNLDIWLQKTPITVIAPVDIYYSLWKRNSTNDYLLGTSNSVAITTNLLNYDIPLTLTAQTNLNSEENFVIKLFANVGGGGGQPRINMTMESTNNSFFKVKSFGKYLQKDGSIPLINNWNQGSFNFTNPNSYFHGKLLDLDNITLIRDYNTSWIQKNQLVNTTDDIHNAINNNTYIKINSSNSLTDLTVLNSTNLSSSLTTNLSSLYIFQPLYFATNPLGRYMNDNPYPTIRGNTTNLFIDSPNQTIFNAQSNIVFNIDMNNNSLGDSLNVRSQNNSQNLFRVDERGYQQWNLRDINNTGVSSGIIGTWNINHNKTSQAQTNGLLLDLNYIGTGNLTENSAGGNYANLDALAFVMRIKKSVNIEKVMGAGGFTTTEPSSSDHANITNAIGMMAYVYHRSLGNITNADSFRSSPIIDSVPYGMANGAGKLFNNTHFRAINPVRITGDILQDTGLKVDTLTANFSKGVEIGYNNNTIQHRLTIGNSQPHSDSPLVGSLVVLKAIGSINVSDTLFYGALVANSPHTFLNYDDKGKLKATEECIVTTSGNILSIKFNDSGQMITEINSTSCMEKEVLEDIKPIYEERIITKEFSKCINQICSKENTCISKAELTEKEAYDYLNERYQEGNCMVNKTYTEKVEVGRIEKKRKLFK